MARNQEKAKKISTRMLGIILPVLIIGMGIITAISLVSSRSIITSQVQTQMNLQLENQSSIITQQVDAAVALGKHMAAIVGQTYQDIDLLSYVYFLYSMIYEEDCIYGSGIWFAPNQYDEKQRYVGPYVYKYGNGPVLTYEYSNSEYDYLNQEYYTAVENQDKGYVYYSQPYYDEKQKKAMVTMAMPMYNSDDEFIGCITVDITTDTMQNMIEGIQIGESGTAFLISVEGMYLAFDDETKIMNAKITEDENSSLAKAGAEMLAADEIGFTQITKSGETYYLYYDEIPNVGWKIGITMRESELNQEVFVLAFQLLVIALIVCILVSLIIFLQIRSVSKQINKVKNFAGELADGNFTVSSLTAKRKDELGLMGSSLNEMYHNNKNLISKIADYSGTLMSSGKGLNKSSDELRNQFGKIARLMNQVSEDMTSSSAATEEVNASVEEMSSSVTVLTEETANSLQLSGEIKERAAEIEKNSMSSYQQATDLSEKHQLGLQESIKNAEVVRSIGELAEVISNIAEEINLLSLNASIEAARAGEQGRGFAVVAGEIGNLASDTSHTVNKIKDTIGDVQGAFDHLVGQSGALLKFMTDTVAPDYDAFVNVSKQYGNDAEQIKKFSDEIAEMSANIEKIIQEVGLAIQNISESSQNTVDNSTEIIQAVDSVSSVIKDVRKMSKNQEVISFELSDVVGNFVLDDKKKNNCIQNQTK